MLKDRRTRKIFIKYFFISAISVLVLAGAVILGWRSFVQPPTVPTIGQHTDNTTGRDDYNGAAFDVATPHPGDALINVDAPVIFTDEDRRSDFYTFLIFGYDEGLNTDTIMVAAYDAAAQRAYILSIPRDTQVDVQRSIRRINSAYPAGRRWPCRWR